MISMEISRYHSVVYRDAEKSLKGKVCDGTNTFITVNTDKFFLGRFFIRMLNSEKIFVLLKCLVVINHSFCKRL